jgi:release factor glutamine methyltransferase
MTLAERLAAARATLTSAGISSNEAANDAELLARHALQWDRARLVTSLRDPAPPGLDPKYRELIARRATREPSSQIIGVREFWGLEFEVGPDVLTPRPETELIIEEALAQFSDPSTPLTIIDVGTGSGCLAVSLAHEYADARILATDISPAALNVARRNAARHAVDGRITFERVPAGPVSVPHAFRPATLVVSNPPYVSSSAAPGLPPEVRDHEPHVALFAGPQGLDMYERLLDTEPGALAPRGRMILELGYDQLDRVCAMAGRRNWQVVSVREDLQGIPRVLTLAAGRRDL